MRKYLDLGLAAIIILCWGLCLFIIYATNEKTKLLMEETHKEVLLLHEMNHSIQNLYSEMHDTTENIRTLLIKEGIIPR